MIDSLVTGGAERSLGDMSPLYAKHGIELHVAYLVPGGSVAERLELEGAIEHSLVGGGGRAGRIQRAIRLIHDLRPDLVHTTLFESDQAGRTAARWTRTPVVSSLVTVAYGQDQRRAPGIRASRLALAGQVDAFTARWVVRFHANTRYVAEVMAPRLRISREVIEVIPRGRDPARLGRRTQERRRGTRERLGVDDASLVVVAAASHEHQKGLDVLIEAFARLRRKHEDARLFLAGREGNATARLRRLVEVQGLEGEVSLLGARSDVPDLICGADIFVLPSRWEGFGGVLLEAMALEAPIVASDLPAIRELLTSRENALLVPRENPDDLAAAMLALSQDPALGRRLAASARGRFLANFSVDRVFEQMAAFYEQALRSSHR